MALDGARAKIRVNRICLGYTQTPMIDGYSRIGPTRTRRGDWQRPYTRSEHSAVHFDRVQRATTAQPRFVTLASKDPEVDPVIGPGLKRTSAT
jgi:NAD(P)-dependent dehydrogenase (short-subunit alcohol dehydrogenase family)